MFANGNPLGFLAASRAQSVIQVIGKTEQLVTTLGTTQADLKPAQDALAAAKALYAAHEYSGAAAQAKRAGALAVSLNERFNAYLEAWTSIQDCMNDLQEIGFPIRDLEAALGAAEEEMVRPVDEEGAVVPNYRGATAMLERAMEEARTLVVRARDASREVFLASLAVEALSESQVNQTANWIAVRLEEMIEQATRELALGNLHVARKLATEARARAEAARARAVQVQELLEEAQVVTEHLREEGLAADALTERVGSLRDAMAQGFPDPTTAMVVVRRLSNEAVHVADQYTRARKVLEHAKRVHARLKLGGFVSYEVDAALLDARRALEAGEWTRVREDVGRASHVFVQRRDERDVLAKGIGEIQERVSLLNGFRLPLLPDVQEILDRAREEFESGRYSGANEDLLFATALMTQATRTGS